MVNAVYWYCRKCKGMLPTIEGTTFMCTEGVTKRIKFCDCDAPEYLAKAELTEFEV